MEYVLSIVTQTLKCLCSLIKEKFPMLFLHHCQVYTCMLLRAAVFLSSIIALLCVSEMYIKMRRRGFITLKLAAKRTWYFEINIFTRILLIDFNFKEE